MRDNPDNPPRHEDDTVRLCLMPSADFSDLAALLNELYHNEQYRVCIDVGAVWRLGTVEFGVLGSFLEPFKRRGGFLRLENASANIVTLVHIFGFAELLADVPAQTASR
jgi:anti-anti-sigma regulatory factor